MTFNSIEEAMAYIENVVASSMPRMGEEMKRIMKESIDKEIYSHHPNTTGTRTGQLGNSAEIIEVSNNGVTTEYMDNGDWESLWGKTKGQHFFPLEGFLAGSVLAPGGGYYQADPTTEAFFQCNEEIPIELKQYLLSRGIPIE